MKNLKISEKCEKMLEKAKIQYNKVVIKMN